MISWSEILGGSATGTFHLKVPDFENRFVILLGIYRESLTNLFSSRSFYFERSNKN